MNNNSPEIQKFLDSAKEEVKSSGESCNLISFGDFWAEKYSANDTNFNSKAFLGDAAALFNHNQVSYYNELTSYRKGISVIVLPIKKVIRKLVKFLFLPIIAEQNEINLSITRLFGHMKSYVNREVGVKDISSMREKELELQVIAQREMINELSAKIDQLSEKIGSLENGGSSK